MPYIQAARRADFEDGDYPENAGELNYILTNVVLSYYQRYGPGYQYLNDILGALEGAKLEFYRRVAAPYEDKKIIENGDVY